MKASNLIALLKTAVAKRWPIMIEGSPGIGKSEIGAQVAAAMSAVYIVLHPCICDPTDFKGFPAVVNGKAVFLTFGELENLLTANVLTIVALEDLGQAPNSVQAALMQMVLLKEIGGKKISPFVTFVAMTNRRTDNAGVSGILSPLRSRFRSSVELTVDVADWAKWALSAGMPIELIAYVQFRPAHLNTFDPKTAREGKPFACPRTLAFLGDWVNAGVLDVETVCGCVGESVGTEFLGFYAIYKTVAGLPAQIIANPLTATVFSEVDKAYALSAAMSYCASVKNLDSIGAYFSRDEMPAEFRTFFWKAATARKPELVNTAAHQRWAIAHADEIQ